MSSIFSKIVRGEIPSYKIAEDDNYYAFLDINPYAKGHTLVIPKYEEDYIFDLDDETLAGLMVFAKKVGKAIRQTIPCKRIALMVLGMEVPHVHIHLIPINKESDLNLSEKIPVSSEELKEIAEKISQNFSSSTAL